jgi:hypothetical protein
MKLPWFLLPILALLSTVGLRAQDAAQPSVDLGTKPEEAAPAKTPPPVSEVPELSQLDEAFKQSSLGKEADESRVRLEIRKLQNQVVGEPAVVAAKTAAHSARTDLEKRDRLRDYYNIYYGKMRALTASAEVRSALDTAKAEHLRLLDQPRVRPVPGTEGIPTPTPTPKQRKEHKGKHSHFLGQ